MKNNNELSDFLFTTFLYLLIYGVGLGLFVLFVVLVVSSFYFISVSGNWGICVYLAILFLIYLYLDYLGYKIEKRR